MRDNLRLRMISSIGDVPAESWNACASDPPAIFNTTRGDRLNPFISHEFLHSLELSKSVGRRTGWDPRHLVAENARGEIVGAVPCYLKSHSRGEYVFDRGWAEAYERAGGSYYPKLQVSVPFTPATGPRLLASPDQRPEQVRAALAGGLVRLC